MDWASAIAINQAALARIVAGLIALVGLASGGTVERLPKPLYRAVLRVLRPAEAAVRRLIVIAARGLKVTLPPLRPRPEGLGRANKGEGRLSFPLFDPRKRFAPARPKRAIPRAEPRIHVFEASPLIPMFRPQPVKRPMPEPKPKEDGTIRAARLLRRLAALKRALDTLPQQARRMARWKAKRARMQGFIFRSPLRPGPPPGHRKKATEEIDFVCESAFNRGSDAILMQASINRLRSRVPGADRFFLCHTSGV